MKKIIIRDSFKLKDNKYLNTKIINVVIISMKPISVNGDIEGFFIPLKKDEAKKRNV